MLNTFNLFYVLIVLIEAFEFLLCYSILTKIKIPLRYCLMYPLLCLLSFLFVNYFTFIFMSIYFFAVGKLLSNRNTNLLWFYSVYTVFSCSVFGYALITLLSYLIGATNYNNYFILINLVVIPLGVVMTTILLLRLIKPNLDFLRKYSDDFPPNFLFTINVLLTICCAIQFTSYWIETHLFKGSNPIRNYMILFFVIIVVVLLKFLNNKTRELRQQQIQDLKENQLTNLTAYVQQVESMYDELRSFRHDYQNVLISLNESLKTKDLTIIENTYNQVLNKEGIALQESQHSLSKLNNLRTLPIKGVFSTHIIGAWQKRINVHLEVEDVIQNEAIDVLDYVRITSILLDNALEAAEKSLAPLLTIVFLASKNGKETQIIIENTCEQEYIDPTKAFQPGYSTKGAERGLGLANINKILKDYPHISLQTETAPYLFRQILTIKEEVLS